MDKTEMRLQDDDGCNCGNCRDMRAFVERCGGKDKATTATLALGEQLAKVLSGVPVNIAAHAVGVYLESNPEVAMYGMVLSLQKAQDAISGAAVSRMRPAGSA